MADTLSYIMQDHLGSTAGSVNTSGTLTSTIKYFSFGLTRSSTGTLPTDKEFTGQRLDNTRLYYYGARYYDPAIGRFISADTIVPDMVPPLRWHHVKLKERMLISGEPPKSIYTSGRIAGSYLNLE